eukprot:CAMPEP_0119344076 /NCGR_PEP_ID=MMETSP1333-20130426/106783_1 /TAXON_ID=418940 /ORGANISM="Scyphosphaera apsteinii, Strain RCC1455" /LENGTH=118 /DNA_ID=CAMNT_0007356499 /DNA_START=853 /DNA_END=1206 /DNA_ORIENTATION=-
MVQVAVANVKLSGYHGAGLLHHSLFNRRAKLHGCHSCVIRDALSGRVGLTLQLVEHVHLADPQFHLFTTYIGMVQVAVANVKLSGYHGAGLLHHSLSLIAVRSLNCMVVIPVFFGTRW